MYFNGEIISMKCFFKKHIFYRAYDRIVGGILGRHVRCKNCNLEYALMWHVEKPHKPVWKTHRANMTELYRWYHI